MGKSKKRLHSKSHRKRKHSYSSTDTEDDYHKHKTKDRKHGRKCSESSSSSSSEWSTSPERSEKSSKTQYKELIYTRTYHKKSRKSYNRKRRARSRSRSYERDRRYRDNKRDRGSFSKERKYGHRSSTKSPEKTRERENEDGKDYVSKKTNVEYIKESETVTKIEKVEQKMEMESKQETIKYVTTLNNSGAAPSRKIEIKISSKKYGQDENKSDKQEKDKTDLIGKWEPVEKKSLKAFTELCKTLVESTEEKYNKESNEESNKGRSNNIQAKEEIAIRHPFLAPPPATSPSIPMTPAQAIQAGMIHQVVHSTRISAHVKEIPSSFPVSSGTHHRAKENAIGASTDATVFEEPKEPPVNISTVIAERLQIQKRLSVEPFNVEAIAKLRDCDNLIKRWSKSGVKPEQFTGEKTKNILTKEELEGGYNAWVRKDFFNNLQPIRDGPGLRLLQKMGWTYGQPLGKNRTGFVNPVAFEIRTDRRGLSTADETASTMKAKRKGPAVIDVQGKHPVSALSEYCTRRKWSLPDFKLIMDSGPSHHKNYMFKVIVNGQEFNPVSPSPNKKNAKAQAATAALQKLGLIT